MHRIHYQTLYAGTGDDEKIQATQGEEQDKTRWRQRRLLNVWLGSGFWLAWLACQRRWGFAAAGCALCVLAPGICICPCRCDRRTAVQPLLADRGTVRSRRWA